MAVTTNKEDKRKKGTPIEHKVVRDFGVTFTKENVHFEFKAVNEDGSYDLVIFNFSSFEAIQLSKDLLIAVVGCEQACRKMVEEEEQEA